MLVVQMQMRKVSGLDGKMIHSNKFEQVLVTCSLVPSPSPQLSMLAVQIMLTSALFVLQAMIGLGTRLHNLTN